MVMDLEYLNIVNSSIGQTLNTQEISSLEIGFIKRKAAENITSIKFWGKIYGELNDYVVAVALMESKDYPKKKFYFCTNSSPDLQQFPEVSQDKREMAKKINGRLKGDPAFLLDESQDNSETNTAFREIDRLVCLVEKIDNATSIVPCGAYLVAPTHQIIHNNGFEGLNWEKALSIYSYFHFRASEDPARTDLIKGDGLVRACDFLDPIVSDLQGTWSIRTDNTKSAVLLRNFQYPGSVFFHKPGSGIHGSVYFGEGLMNKDIAFML